MSSNIEQLPIVSSVYTSRPFERLSTISGHMIIPIVAEIRLDKVLEEVLYLTALCFLGSHCEEVLCLE